MTKKYSSFSEIDHDLKILRLQREIAKESLKLDLKITKDHLEPRQMIQTASFDIKRSLIDFALSKGLEWLRRLGRKS
ncbi:DUF6327 family protein [Zobellia galactanivorans]|uniref:Uncharacterized protein n=1 Tax=Zobellia galactanivorans (strain DSM 12802 / CCUG 47099 / CIP 106680 / NCIMB 13871 / Dsij) TaxID=63186 RepID=G0L289_ZOBGA|nr:MULTISPECIES: DUF6327 family protein [Zobellia]MBU3024487.1 hypothetical protein [Zobellia galactanivorans]MDO6807590.1 DUF6327 family protein [Zobellia galactanivorans]OWW25402.1 hypothetical protein B4Q04_07220 [Zobellia sp. OII3]CAZ97984.1 Conserved hypothetical protein [Zobellia galactanivorans]